MTRSKVISASSDGDKEQMYVEINFQKFVEIISLKNGDEIDADIDGYEDDSSTP